MSKRNRARGQEAKVIVPGRWFSEHRLTSRAGLVMAARFARKLDLGKIIDEMVHLERGANARYPLGKIVTGIALGIISAGDLGTPYLIRGRDQRMGYFRVTTCLGHSHCPQI